MGDVKTGSWERERRFSVESKQKKEGRIDSFMYLSMTRHVSSEPPNVKNSLR